MNNKCEYIVKKKCIVTDKIFSLLMMPGIIFSLLLPLIVFYDIIPKSKEIVITIIICLIVTELIGGYIILIYNDKYGKNIDSTGEYSLNYIQQWDWDGLFSITGLWIGSLFFSWWCTLTVKIMFAVQQELDFMDSFLAACSLVFGFIIAVHLWYNIKRLMLCKIKKILNNK